MNIFFTLLGLALAAAAVGFGRAAWGDAGLVWLPLLLAFVCLVAGGGVLLVVWQMQTGRVGFKEGCKEIASFLLSLAPLS